MCPSILVLHLVDAQVAQARSPPVAAFSTGAWDQGIPFYEIFLDVPVDELKKRDPKGQYARVESGELKHFTCIDDPYEEPLKPEITLKTHELKIEESADMLFRMLERDGILEGAPKLTPAGLPNPDDN